MRSKYSRSDFSRLCKIPADIPDITPTSLRNTHFGSRQMGKVAVECRFLHEQSKWGRLEYKKGTLSAGIIHMEIFFKNLHDCVLDSAVIRVILDGEHALLKRYHKVVDQKEMKNPVEVKQLGPVSIVGTPFGVSSRTTFSVSPYIEAAGFGFSALEASKEKEQVRETRWVFEGSACPHKSRDGTVNSVEWALKENAAEGQPSHGNHFRTAFVFANDGKPFFVRVEIEGTLSKTRHRVKEKVKGVLYRFGSQKESPTTLIRGFEDETQRLNKLAERLDEDMNKVNGAVNYNQRPDERADGSNLSAAHDVDEGLRDGQDHDGSEKLPRAVEPKTFADMVKLHSQPDKGYSHSDGMEPTSPRAEMTPTTPPSVKLGDDTGALLRALVLVLGLLGRIQQLLVSGYA